MYNPYFCCCIISLIFLVSLSSALPTVLSNSNVDSVGSLPALIPDRIQMPSGAALSGLEQQEKMAHDVKPQPVPQATVNYLRSLVEVLKAVYCTSVAQDGEWKCAYCPPQVSLVLHFPSTVTNDFTGIITRDNSKKTFYLLFPGTKSIQNLVTDLQFISVDYAPVGQGTKIHKGIYDSYMTKQRLIQKTMLDEMSKYPEYQVVVIGHSLGAGIAGTVVLDLYQRNKFLNENNLLLVTAGGPAFWNRELSFYAASTKINMIRLTQNNDIVAGTSDALKLTGFVQSGVEYWIQDAQSVLVCQSVFETPNCINSRLLNPTKLTTGFRDHVIYFGERISQCGIDEPITDPHQITHLLTNL